MGLLGIVIYNVIYFLFKFVGNSNLRIIEGLLDLIWIVLYYLNILDVVIVVYGINFEINLVF